MFNFSSVNTAEVNASSLAPAAPVLTILATEDENALSWTSPILTDFFAVYWSNNSFTSIDELGVRVITSAIPTPGATPITEVSYTHTIPATYSLSVLYYRVASFNSNGISLSNQVDSYNFKLAIYEDLYDATLEELTLRFTPELRRQYEDSILWKSFVQSICSELAQGRFEIKEALKQLNLQKAIGVFLNLWNDITGISRMNLTNSVTGVWEPETDVEYRQRLVDSVFWDKVSNVALKKTMLLKFGYDVDILDEGMDASIFKDVPEPTTTKYKANHGAAFIPGEVVNFLFVGPDGTATCSSDTGTVLTYAGHAGVVGTPYSLFGENSWMSAVPTGPPSAYPNGTIAHAVLSNPSAGSPFIVGEAITFMGSGATGVVVSDISGVLTFTVVGGTLPAQWDLVRNSGAARTVLTSAVTQLTSVGASIHSKILSNVYSIALGSTNLPDADLNAIYDAISPLAALGNVLTKILQDVATSFNDYDSVSGNIPYGPIFMAAETYTGVKSTESNWAVAEALYMDNQWTMGSGKIFYGNDGPDDIAVLTRIS